MPPQDAGHSLPPMMAFPSPAIREKITSKDWSTCLEAWRLLSHVYLSLPAETFEIVLASGSSSLVAFLTTYMTNMATSKHDTNLTSASHDRLLQRNVFLLVHRTFADVKQPASSLLDWAVWGDLSRVYRHVPVLGSLLENAWRKFSEQVESSLLKYKGILLKQLDKGGIDNQAQEQLTLRLLPLLRACPLAGASIIAGSDLLDSITAAYSRAAAPVTSQLLLLVYLGLNALTIGTKPNNGLLLDHLYSLKSSADNGQQSLLADLVTDTPILARLKKHFSGPAENARANSVISAISAYRKTESKRPRRVAPRSSKGKARAIDEYGHNATGEVHIHKMSLITQIQDLFPDLGSGFIHKLLEEYHDNVEDVTVHLLEDSLPQHLQSANRSEQLPTPQQPTHDLAPHLAPRPTPPASPLRERHNLYADDDLADLTLGTNRLHIGRRDADATADALLTNQTTTDRATSKAAILSALAAFDADDDEHDDTYDLEDVGGTVDSARPGGLTEDGDANINDMRDKNEEALYSAFRMNPEIFERSSATRLSQPRRALKTETGMTDEAIEGWGVMLRRDPRRLRRLELKYNTFGGQQAELDRTAWRGGVESTEDSEASGTEGGRGVFKGRGRGGRGRGGGGGGRGGNVAGPADDKNTQNARHRKEANKGSRANHNRRDQRARKVARAGFPG